MNRRVEIGSTWYRERVQRTGANIEAKILLLTHAFDRVGAKRDGILCSHAVHANGALRETYVYRITAAESPTVRAHLTAKR